MLLVGICRCRSFIFLGFDPLQVIFLALDSRVDNIACTYSLEHKSIDDLFESFFRLVEASLMEGKGRDLKSCSFQDIMFSVGTIQASICKHMLKEEKQVTTCSSTFPVDFLS